MAAYIGSDPEMNTLEDSLKYFRKSAILTDLEESLERVRRNKKSKEEHQEYFNTADKELLKLSLKCHPDRAKSRGGSDSEVAAANKLQSALNASRTLLKLLTKTFLDDISIDYKYEYFAKLEISSLVNENEIDRRIGDVLYKISELSEIKRMNIVGEIRKFLLESQLCVKSYFAREKDDFKKYCDYALYRLNKCIEGYKKLETECSLLEKECRDENDQNIRSVIIKVADQSARELSILTRLESVARDSLKGSLKIFTVDAPMDEYFVQPFVYYINVFLMCNVMLGKRSRFPWFSLGSDCLNPYFVEKLPVPFARAYHLASHFKDKTQYTKEVEKIMKNKFSVRMKEDGEISVEDISAEFDVNLREILEVLEKDFRVDSYSESKSNREQLSEKLSRLMKEVAEFKEKEKRLGENISMYKKDYEKFRREYHQVIEKNEEVTLENLELMRNASEACQDSLSNLNQNITESGSMFKTEGHQNSGKSVNVMTEDDKEFVERAQKVLDEYKRMGEQFSQLLLSCKQNITEHKRVFGNESHEDWNKHLLVIKDGEEMEKKILEVEELNYKVCERLSELLSSKDGTENTRLNRNEIGGISTQNEEVVGDQEMESQIQINAEQEKNASDQFPHLLLFNS